MPAAAPAGAAETVPLRLPEQVWRTAPAPGALYVECGSFTRPQYAAIMQRRLAGLDARVSTDSRAPREAAWRVRIGPLRDIAEADATLDRALAAGVSDARIIVDDPSAIRVPRKECHPMLSRRFLLAGAALGAVSLDAAGVGAPVRAAEPAHPPRPGARPPAAAHGARRPAEAAAPTGSPANTPLGPLDTAARWAVILDFTTGATLLDKDADVPMPPSSMTKLMTMYIVYSLLKSGRLKLDQDLPVSERAWRMGGSKMFVQIGSQVKVEDLIRGVIVQSGNDACIVFAEAIAGSEEQFAEQMNQKARELGMDHTNFRNATGWPDPEQRMSARDIATLARRLIQDFPEYYKYDSEKSFKYNNIEQQNRNPLVQKGLADGLKTGHTDDGGFGLVASAERSGRRVVLVVNGLTFHASARRRKRAAAGMVVPRVRERHPVHRRQHGRTGPGLARHPAYGAAGGRARSGGDHAAGLAQDRQDHAGIRQPGRRPDHPRHDARAFVGDRAGGSRPAGAVAGRRRRAAAGPARPRPGGADPLHDG